MEPAICLLLDHECRIVLATFLEGDMPAVADDARRLEAETGAAGFEIWRGSRRLLASHQDGAPPARLV